MVLPWTLPTPFMVTLMPAEIFTTTEERTSKEIRYLNILAAENDLYLLISSYSQCEEPEVGGFMNLVSIWFEQSRICQWANRARGPLNILKFRRPGQHFENPMKCYWLHLVFELTSIMVWFQFLKIAETIINYLFSKIDQI